VKARIGRFFLATLFGLALALPVGAFVQSRLSFDILAVETGAPALIDALILVALSGLIAVLAAVLVALPIGRLVRRVLGRERDIVAAATVSSLAAVLLFVLLLVPWGVPPAELALLLLLCASFYVAFFLVDRPRRV